MFICWIFLFDIFTCFSYFSLQLYHIIKLIYRWLYRLKALNKRLIYPLHFNHQTITLAALFKKYRRIVSALQVFTWSWVCMLLRKDTDNTSIYFPLLCDASGYLAVVIIIAAINCHHHFPSMIYRRQTFLYYEKLCRSLQAFVRILFLIALIKSVALSIVITDVIAFHLWN